MKVIAALALFAGSAAAFAPAQTGKATTVLNAYENEVGAQAPLGFWDPLNFLLDQPQERFDRLRYVELKHGRIAQLAVLGHVVTTAGVRLPGNIDMAGHSFADVRVGLAGLSDIPQAGVVQIVAFIGCMELFFMKDVTGGEFPGDFRNGHIDFGWDEQTDEWKLQKRAVELNNGRAAQMGILGLMMHEVMTGEPYVINSIIGYPSHFNGA